jgi:hypothetical protein
VTVEHRETPTDWHGLPARDRSWTARPYYESRAVSGEGGIRTHGTCYRTRHFQCRTFGLSVTSPEWLNFMMLNGLCQVDFLGFPIQMTLIQFSDNRGADPGVQDTECATHLLPGAWREVVDSRLVSRPFNHLVSPAPTPFGRPRSPRRLQTPWPVLRAPVTSPVRHRCSDRTDSLPSRPQPRDRSPRPHRPPGPRRGRRLRTRLPETLNRIRYGLREFLQDVDQCSGVSSRNRPGECNCRTNPANTCHHATVIAVGNAADGRGFQRGSPA